MLALDKITSLDSFNTASLASTTSRLAMAASANSRNIGRGDPTELTCATGLSQTPAAERDLRNYLVKNLAVVEPGLRLYEEEGISGVEFPVGRTVYRHPSGASGRSLSCHRTEGVSGVRPCGRPATPLHGLGPAKHGRLSTSSRHHHRKLDYGRPEARYLKNFRRAPN